MLMYKLCGAGRLRQIEEQIERNCQSFVEAIESFVLNKWNSDDFFSHSESFIENPFKLLSA